MTQSKKGWERGKGRSRDDDTNRREAEILKKTLKFGKTTE